MINIKKKDIDLLCYFVFNSIAINSNKTDFPSNVKFVFSKEDIELLEYLVNNKKSKDYKYYLYPKDIEKVITQLKYNLLEYLYERKDNNYYIYIEDIERFTKLLSKLNKSIKKGLNGDGYDFSDYILESVWLRMSPNDYDNIYNFLEKQIAFSNSNYFTVPSIESKEYKKSTYHTNLLDYKVFYQINTAGPWYESNRKMSISIEDEKERRLYLPEIYFNVIDEDDKKQCYVYAIQNPKSEHYYSVDNIEEKLVNTKRQLRNKYVNYKFILALKYFIDIMKENEIYDIKVPLLQVFNYDYHVTMSDNYKRIMSRFEEDIKKGTTTKEDYSYLQMKKTYDKVADKEDIISKNKTERLVETFLLLQEKYDGIEILTDPFIEDENLIVKIKKTTM